MKMLVGQLVCPALKVVASCRLSKAGTARAKLHCPGQAFRDFQLCSACLCLLTPQQVS